MRGPVSIPQGFTLKAFGITSSPTQIDGFEDQAKMMIDLLPWLQEANSIIIDGNATMAIGGLGYGSGGLGLGPDPGEIWLVQYASLSVSVPAGDGIDFHLARTSNVAPGINVVVGPEAFGNRLHAASTNAALPVAYNDRPFFLNGRNQEQIGNFCKYFDAGVAFATSVNALYWRFDA